MSYYIFKFKKGDSILEAETQDTELLSREFEKSVNEAFGLTCEKFKKPVYKKPLSIETNKKAFQQHPLQIRRPAGMVEVSEKKRVNDEVSKQFESFLQKSANSQKTVETNIEPKVQEKVDLPEIIEPASNKVESQPSFFEEMSNDFKVISPDDLFGSENSEEEKIEVENVEKTISNITQNFETENVEPVVNLENIEEEIDFDADALNIVEDSVNLADLEAAPKGETNANDFYEVLQQKFATTSEDIANDISSTNTVNSMDEVKTIDDLYKLKSPETMLDYLVTTAYYLKFFENSDRYSLKQLNLKILPVSKVPVNHAIIQEAVSANYIEVVPDYTGTAYVTEYALTDEGARYVLNEL